MSLLKPSLSFILILLSASANLTAQDVEPKVDMMKAMMPGPQHNELCELEGEWVVRTEFLGIKTPAIWGRSTWKSILGGRFVEGTTEGFMMGMTVTSRDLLGYDNTKKVFTSLSLSTLATGAMHSEGLKQADGSVEYRGTIFEYPTPEGRPFRVVMKQEQNHYWVDVYDQASPKVEKKVVEIRAWRLTNLFNGKDLKGWDLVGADFKVDLSETWNAKAGIIRCTGRPVGYLRTVKSYANYELELEWRWDKDSKGGNSGLLLHTSTEKAIGVWPKSLEVQLQSGSAGDFWQINETIEVDNQKSRMSGRRIKRLGDTSPEFAVGKWNRMKVRCLDDKVEAWVNDKLLNKGQQCSAKSGKICLQSEGTPISFRNIRIAQLGEQE